MRVPENPIFTRLTGYANGKFRIADEAIERLHEKSGSIEISAVDVAQEIDRMLSRPVKTREEILEELRLVAHS